MAQGWRSSDRSYTTQLQTEIKVSLHSQLPGSALRSRGSNAQNIVHSPAQGPSTPPPSWDPGDRAGPGEAPTEAGPAGSADRHPFPVLGGVTSADFRTPGSPRGSRLVQMRGGESQRAFSSFCKSCTGSGRSTATPPHSWRGRNRRTQMTLLPGGLKSRPHVSGPQEILSRHSLAPLLPRTSGAQPSG